MWFPDFLICKLLLGEKHLFPWRADRIITLFSRCRSRNEFLLIPDKWRIIPWEEVEAHTCGGHPAVLVGFPLARHRSPSVPAPVPAAGPGIPAIWAPGQRADPREGEPRQFRHGGRGWGSPGPARAVSPQTCRPFLALPASFPEYLLPAVTKETELLSAAAPRSAHTGGRGSCGHRRGLRQPQPGQGTPGCCPTALSQSPNEGQHLPHTALTYGRGGSRSVPSAGAAWRGPPGTSKVLLPSHTRP